MTAEQQILTELADMFLNISKSYRNAAQGFNTGPQIPLATKPAAPCIVSVKEVFKNSFKHLYYDVKWVHHDGRQYYDISRKGVRLGRLNMERNDDKLRRELEALERDINQYPVCTRIHIHGKNTLAFYLFTSNHLGSVVLKQQMMRDLEVALMHPDLTLETLFPGPGPTDLQIQAVAIGNCRTPDISDLTLHFENPNCTWAFYVPAFHHHSLAVPPSVNHVHAAHHGIVFKQVINKRVRLKVNRGPMNVTSHP